MTGIIRRRHQVDYKGNPVCADQIIGGYIVAETWAGVDAWIKRLQKHPLAFNHFTRFREVRGPAVQFGHNGTTHTHINR